MWWGFGGKRLWSDLIGSHPWKPKQQKASTSATFTDLAVSRPHERTSQFPVKGFDVAVATGPLGCCTNYIRFNQVWIPVIHSGFQVRVSVVNCTYFLWSPRAADCENTNVQVRGFEVFPSAPRAKWETCVKYHSNISGWRGGAIHAVDVNDVNLERRDFGVKVNVL